MGTRRVAALADLHCTKTSRGAFQPLFARIAESAELLLIAGDLTDYGLTEEARILARELSALRIPVVAVLGNHDFESGMEGEIRQILADAGVIVLDGDACEIHGVGIAGVKGFGGGFGQRALGLWGETIIKQYVRAAVDEALKLEAALARLRTDHLIALLHYSPVQQTVDGEPLEIYPFLGSSRLEEPINRYPVSIVLHGHAHRGQLEGATKSGVRVYNVSMPLLTRVYADRLPFRVFEVPAADRLPGAAPSAPAVPSVAAASLSGAPQASQSMPSPTPVPETQPQQDDASSSATAPSRPPAPAGPAATGMPVSLPVGGRVAEPSRPGSLETEGEEDRGRSEGVSRVPVEGRAFGRSGGRR